MELTTYAGPWAALLLGLFLALASAGEAAPDFGDPSLFTEGGNLSSDLNVVVKRKVTARKEALQSAPSSENATQEAIAPVDLKQVENPPEKIAEHIVSEAAPLEPAQPTSTLRSNDTQKLNVSISESPAPVSTVALNTTKAVTASDKPVNSTINLTESPLAGKKSKPDVTFDIDDLPRDENGNVIVSKENLIGAGPSFDFVVPIVIALLAVPFVAVLGAYVYKKSRDFWDRRHYRRMDFLIDGMYND